MRADTLLLGNLKCIVVIRRATVEHDAQRENLQNTTGNTETPKHGFNLVDMSAHPSVRGGADLIIIVPNLCSAPYPAVSHRTASPSVRKISVCCSPLGPSDLAVSQQAAAPLAADSSWIWLTGLSENEADKQCNPRRGYIIHHPFTLAHLSSISPRWVE